MLARRLALLAVVVLNAPSASAVDMPAPPYSSCDESAPPPNYAPLGAEPNVRLLKDTRPPVLPAGRGCGGIVIPEFGSYVEVAGTFRMTNGKESLLSRIGNISNLTQVRYWSITSHAWRQLISAATALTQSRHPRKDFTAIELENGTDLFLSQTDNRSTSSVTYKMRLRDGGPRSLVLDVENISPVRWWLLTLYDPGELHSVYILHQDSAEIWTYYSLTVIGSGHSLPSANDKSYINRVVALYRHYTGARTDSEPPPAP